MRPPFQNRQMIRAGASALPPPIRRPPPAISPEAMAITSAQHEGGAGLLADETLRYFQLEYTNRVVSFGRNSMPSSYEVMDAFFEYRPEMAGLFLLAEKDYIFSFSDFLDFVTSTTAPGTDIQHLQGFESGVIHNATSNDALGDLLLETKGTSAYAVRAASLVRSGDYLTVMLCLAEQMPEADMALMATSFEGTTPNPLKLAIHNKVVASNMAPSLIPGTELLTSIAMVRFNLKSGEIQSRCLMRDMTESFQVWTDVVNTVGFSGLTADSPLFTNMVAELDESDAIWEVAKTLTLLPAYLEAKIAYVRTEQKATKLGVTASTSAKLRREMANRAPQDRVLFKTIAAIEAPPSDRSQHMDGRSYSPPTFQVPVAGYWRVYNDPIRGGHDELGNPIVGKTWVKSHLRHKDKEEAPAIKVVYIKASLSDARRRLAKYRADADIVEGTQARVESELPSAAATVAPSPVRAHKVIDERTDSSGAGADAVVGEELATGAFVYVMRCHAHSENLFKVGFTDRDPKLRAKELSSTTSAPSPFLVLQAWAVTDGYSAEQSAHAELKDVRLSANREFFQLDYRELCQRLERSLKEWLL